MHDEFDNNLAMARRVKSYLEAPENKPIWENQPPLRFTTRAVELYPAIDDFAALAARQSTPARGSADQQNIHEKALEDAAHPLANALREYYLDNARADEAAEWDLSLSDWRRMREQALLGKAQRLHDQIRAVGAGEGGPYGMSDAARTNLDEMIGDYAEAIGKPTEKRARKAADTASLRPAWRGVREILEAMDNLVVQFPASFSQGWFAARRIDDRGVTGKAAETPPLPTGP